MKAAKVATCENVNLVKYYYVVCYMCTSITEAWFRYRVQICYMIMLFEYIINLLHDKNTLGFEYYCVKILYIYSKKW